MTRKLPADEGHVHPIRGSRSFTQVSLAMTVLALLAGINVPASADDAQALQQLRQQLDRMQAEFEKQQQLQRQQMDAIRRQIETLQGKPGVQAPQPTAPPTSPTPSTTEAPKPVGTGNSTLDAGKAWSPSDPIRLQSGRSLLDISLNGTLATGGSTASQIDGGTQLGGHDPKVNGFTLQSLELSLSGMVDPYFRATTDIALHLDSSGESSLEIEEAYMETLSLPGKLTLRAGQFLTPFGRHNMQHVHEWSFVDSPVAHARLLGPDGLRNLGGQISWLMPFRFHSELTLAVQNSAGETASSFRFDNEGEARFHRQLGDLRANRLGDLLFTPRWSTSFDLTDSQTIVVGASSAIGPNASGAEEQTRIHGADLFWKWKPTRHQGGFPFVSWQSEALIRRYQAGAFDWDLDGDGLVNADGSELDGNGDALPDVLPRETFQDYGFYSQLSYGFRRGWVVGIRGEMVDRRHQAIYEGLFGDDTDRLGRWRLSPNLTWHPTEFSRLRLQYNHDQRRQIGADHSVWLQMDFSLGAHGAHKF
ncbi:MAG: hypothetical protein FJ405_11940 [Verrucomicrobia bacterium]|nr:hypothetical protein [Verrucomicrobiota bacterium]